nr:hypothetical protein [Candidatus Sigynarchaeota archaeon]
MSQPTEYIELKCFLYRCGDHAGNLEQCKALLSEIGNADEHLDEDERDEAIDALLDAVNRKNWEQRGCHN